MYSGYFHPWPERLMCNKRKRQNQENMAKTNWRSRDVMYQKDIQSLLFPVVVVKEAPSIAMHKARKRYVPFSHSHPGVPIWRFRTHADQVPGDPLVHGPAALSARRHQSSLFRGCWEFFQRASDPTTLLQQLLASPPPTVGHIINTSG